jgi:hypothetical protein
MRRLLSLNLLEATALLETLMTVPLAGASNKRARVGEHQATFVNANDLSEVGVPRLIAALVFFEAGVALGVRCDREVAHLGACSREMSTLSPIVRLGIVRAKLRGSGWCPS